MAAGVEKLLTPELPAAVPVTRVVDPDQALGMAQHTAAMVLRHVRGLARYDEQQQRRIVAVSPQQPCERRDQGALHDEHEATEVVWTTPCDALERYWDGAIDLAPPQIMSLAQLARLRDVQQALALARSRPPTLIEPEPFDEDGCRVICYPGDPRHSVARSVWQGPTRLTHRNRRFEPDGGLAALLGPQAAGRCRHPS